MKTEAKTGFKQTVIGVMPEDWVLMEFGKLFKVPLRNGLTRPTKVRGSGIKMVNMGELFAYDRMRNVPMERVPVSNKEKNDYLLCPGDLIFARQSLLLSGVGKCSIFLGDDEEVTFEGHLIRVRLGESSSPMFYYYFFKSEKGKAIIQEFSEQVAASGIRGSDLARIPVPVPSFGEQQSIAKILSDFDSKIELNRQMGRTLESMASAIFKHWFVDFEFPNEEGKPYKSSGGEMVVSELGRIPENWRVGVIPDIADVIYGYPFDSKLFNEERGFPLVRIRDLPANNPSTFTTEDFGERYVIRKGDVVAGMDGEFGTYLWKGPDTLQNQRICKFIGKTREYSNAFIYFVVSKPLKVIEGAKVGTTVIHLSKQDIDSVRIIIPPKEVLREYNILAIPLFAQMTIGGHENLVLEQSRDTLLPKLLSGKIRAPVEVR